MNTLSVLHQFSTSKEGIADFVSKTVNEVESGNVSALDLKIYLKSIEKAIKEIDEQTKDLQLSEAEKYGKSFDHAGARIDISEMGTKYDYTECNDEKYSNLINLKNNVDGFVKERESFLKTIKVSMNIVNEDGEAVTIYAPVKQSTTGIKITIK